MTEGYTPELIERTVLHRDPLALAMFAAWCNLPVDKLPEAMRAHTCPATAEAWGRVADAARTVLLGPDGLDWLESASLAGADAVNKSLRDRVAALEGALGEATDQLWHLAKDLGTNPLVKELTSILSRAQQGLPE
jgi:hypothetical protein